MGVEVRKGRLYWYERRPTSGRAVRVYVGPLTPAEATLLGRRAEVAAENRRTARADRDAAGRLAEGVLAAAGGFDRHADRLFRAVLHLAGYGQHKRGEWRHKRGAGAMMKLDELIGAMSGTYPALVAPAAPRPEDQATLDRAARGDWSVLPRVRELLRDQQYRDAVGGAGELALAALVATAAGSNVLVGVAMKEKHAEYVAGLLADGPPPTFAERMAATRAANNWLAVHILEAMAALRKPASAEAVAIERRATQAERRLHAALRSLTVLRRLRKPTKGAPTRNPTENQA